MCECRSGVLWTILRYDFRKMKSKITTHWFVWFETPGLLEIVDELWVRLFSIKLQWIKQGCRCQSFTAFSPKKVHKLEQERGEGLMLLAKSFPFPRKISSLISEKRGWFFYILFHWNFDFFKCLKSKFQLARTVTYLNILFITVLRSQKINFLRNKGLTQVVNTLGRLEVIEIEFEFSIQRYLKFSSFSNQIKSFHSAQTRIGQMDITNVTYIKKLWNVTNSKWISKLNTNM